MQIKKLFFCLLLLCLTLGLKAQESSPFHIGFEVGGGSLLGEKDSRWNISQDMRSYGQYYSSSYYEANAEASQFYVGIKPEFIFMKGRLSVASGLRFSTTYEKIGGTEWDDSDKSSYFFLRHQGNDGLEFYRIRSIKETVNHLSIPLEATLIISGIKNDWQIYIKGGALFGSKVYAKTHFDFLLPEMDRYQDELLRASGSDINSFYFTLYGEFGLRIKQENGVRYNLGLTTPVGHLTKNNFRLFDADSFVGVHFSVSSPFNLLKK